MEWFTSLSDIITGLLKGSEKRQDKIFNRIKKLPGDEVDRKKLYEVEIKNLQGEVWMRRVILLFILFGVAVLCWVFLLNPALTGVDSAAQVLIDKKEDDNSYGFIREEGTAYVTYNDEKKAFCF